CYDCGALPEELVHLQEGKHKYAELELFGSNLILCDFCQVDFDSYSPGYFRRTGKPRFSSQMRFVRDVEKPSLSNDKYCPNCHRRLVFLRFLAHALSTPEV